MKLLLLLPLLFIGHRIPATAAVTVVTVIGTATVAVVAATEAAPPRMGHCRAMTMVILVAVLIQFKSTIVKPTHAKHGWLRTLESAALMTQLKIKTARAFATLLVECVV